MWIKKNLFFFFVTTLLSMVSCTQEETIVVDNNKIPNYKIVSTLRIENYVQRIFIDVLGRDATDIERISLTNQLKIAELHDSCRRKIIHLLLFDTLYRSGDSSYRHAFSQRIYDISKARYIEGAEDGVFWQQIGILGFGILVARLDGDSVKVHEYLDQQKMYSNVLSSKMRFRKNLIDYRQMSSVMMNNPIYNVINMNSFNFVNASYDDALLRKPSDDEFKRAYNIIEQNVPSPIFGKWASNKNEFCTALTESDAFHEAQIRWLYFVMVQREPSNQEVIRLFKPYFSDHKIESIIEEILITDEYAQFY